MSKSSKYQCGNGGFISAGIDPYSWGSVTPYCGYYTVCRCLADIPDAPDAVKDFITISTSSDITVTYYDNSATLLITSYPVPVLSWADPSVVDTLSPYSWRVWYRGRDVDTYVDVVYTVTGGDDVSGYTSTLQATLFGDVDLVADTDIAGTLATSIVSADFSILVRYKLLAIPDMEIGSTFIVSKSAGVSFGL